MGTGAHGVLGQGSLSEATIVAYEARRLTIVATGGYDEFVAGFEAAVPVLEQARFQALVDSGGGWDDVLAAADENAPHGFMRFWQADVTAMMSPLGVPWRCTEYLMGNQTIAARMYRHDPAVMLYAPLRVTIHTRPDGAGCVGIDRPGAQLGSFGDPRIASVGLELDRKVAQLLEAIGVPAPSELTADDRPA